MQLDIDLFVPVGIQLHAALLLAHGAEVVGGLKGDPRKVAFHGVSHHVLKEAPTSNANRKYSLSLACRLPKRCVCWRKLKAPISPSSEAPEVIAAGLLGAKWAYPGCPQVTVVNRGAMPPADSTAAGWQR
jgi:hypothetical protein